MSHQTPESGIIGGINITPMVDIVLVLLVVFIVTAKIIVAPAVPLDLPKAASGEQVQAIFSVIVPRAGPTLCNGVATPLGADLLRAGQDALRRDPQVRAVISADGEVPHRRVMRTLDLLKQAGITKIAFGVAPGEREEP